MRNQITAVCLGLALAGCSERVPETAQQYRVGVAEQRYLVHFQEGRADPVPDDAEKLGNLPTAVDPALGRASYVLAADGPLARLRAARVSELARVPVSSAPDDSGETGRDDAVLIVKRSGIVADACSGPPQYTGRQFFAWFGDEGRRPLLPAGCAVALSILEQAANRRDLLRGRALEPGAAGPMARAADAYLHRNDQRAAGGTDRDRSAAGGATTEDRNPPGNPSPPGPSSNQPPTGSGAASAPASPSDAPATAPSR